MRLPYFVVSVTYLLANKVCGRVVEEGLENSHQGVLVLAEEAKGEFAGFAERSCWVDGLVETAIWKKEIERDPIRTYRCNRMRQRHRSCYA